MPSTSPLTVTLVAAADAFVVTFDEPAVAVTTYPVSALPPSSAGALHDTSNPACRPNTDVNNGADGTCAGNGTTGFEAALNALEPVEFDADTFATYATPLHNPPTTPAELDPETDEVKGPTQFVGGVTPLAGDTEIRYPVTCCAAGSGFHDTNNPRPSPTTDVTNGTLGFASAAAALTACCAPAGRDDEDAEAEPRSPGEGDDKPNATALEEAPTSTATTTTANTRVNRPTNIQAPQQCRVSPRRPQENAAP